MDFQLTKETPEELHSKGADLRENDKHLEALQVLTLAIAKYQEEKNYKGMIDVLKDRVLTWKHLALLSDDNSFKILAMKDAESMLEVTKEFDLEEKYHTSYFRIGEICMISDKFEKAVKNYEKALETYVGPLSEKGDYRYHLGEALYKTGKKKKGKDTILKGLEEIREGASELDPFLIHVWESGAHMRLAELLGEDEPEKARKHLKKAKEIAESDEKLVIRRRQIEDLEKKMEN